MKRLALALCLAVLSSSSSYAATPTRLATIAAHRASVAVQHAIVNDYCADQSSSVARATLSSQGKLSYDKVSELLSKAYAATSGKESELESIMESFCSSIR